MTPCALTTSGASTSSGIATGRALGPSMALRVRAHRPKDSRVRRPTAPDGALRVRETSVATGNSPTDSSKGR
jgi:hypothetical protein